MLEATRRRSTTRYRDPASTYAYKTMGVPFVEGDNVGEPNSRASPPTIFYVCASKFRPYEHWDPL